MVVRREEMKLSNQFNKKLLLVLLPVFISSLAFSQKKEYYLNKNMVGLQYYTLHVLVQANHYHIYNPKEKFMWMSKLGVVYGPLEAHPWHYQTGALLAYGGKNRVVIGLGGDYNPGFKDLQDELNFTGEIGYMVFGKKRLFLGTTILFLFNPFYKDPRFNWNYSEPNLIFTLGWKF